MKPRSGEVVQANPSRDQRACCFGSKAALWTVPYGVPHVPLLRGGTTADRQGGSSVMKVSVEDIPTVPVNQKGILIRIRDDSGKNVGKSGSGISVRWARGTTPDMSAKRVTLRQFVDSLNQL
jgi:hypothetical protein